MSETLERLRAALRDRYVVEREVGHGGMATVYFARDLKHDRAVAIKVMRPELAASMGHERFLREIEIAAKLQHPHILAVYDSGDAAGLLYYVMPFIEGESLAERLARRGALPPEEACRIVTEVASALDYAHQRGVVHRDIKPANILLTHGHAVVADFGIARALSASGGAGLTQTGMAVGTPHYMSPEQALGQTDLDGRTDIYSLGCVFYEMLSGKPPFTGSTPQAILAQSIAGTTPKRRPPGAPGALTRAMAREPADRFATAGEFAAALRQRGAPRLTPRRTTSLLGAGAIGVMVLGGLYFWLSPRDSTASVTRDAEVIAVLPFSTTGRNVELLGEGMADLLATNFDGVGGMRVIDPRIIMRQWRRRQQGGEVSLDDARSIGRNVDAGSVLVGTVVEAGPTVRMRGALYAVDGGELASATVDGPADSVLALVDSLSIHLLHEIWQGTATMPSIKVAAVTTGSVAAVRHFLRGAQHFRRAEFDSAIAAFDRAVEEDTTFALAHTYLADTYGWTVGPGAPPVQRHLARAGQFIHRLPPRERHIVTAAQLFGGGDPFGARDSMRAFVTRYPNDARGWEILGDVQFHIKTVLQLTVDELYAPFERAMAIDPSYVPAYFHPLEMAFALADSGRIRRYFQTIDAEAAETEFVDRYRLAADVVWGDRDSTGARLLRLARRWSGGVQAVISSCYQGGPLSPSIAVAIVDSLRRELASDDPLRAEAAGGALVGLLSLGRIAEARQLARDEFAASPRTGTQLMTALAAAGHLGGGEADTAFALMERGAPHVAKYLQVIAAIHRDEPREARRIIGAFRSADTARVAPVFRRAMDAFEGAVQIAEGDTLRGITTIRTVFQHAGVAAVSSQLFTPPRFMLAAAQVTQPQYRSEGIRRLRAGFTDGLIDNFAIHPIALRILGEALAAAGDRAGAALAFSRFVELWNDADDGYQPLVEDIRGRIKRLSEEGGR